MATVLRKCSKCGIEKEATLENFIRRGAGGLDFTWCKACRKEYDRRNREQLKAWAFAAYSKTDPPSCSCCNEQELAFLTIDHINGGGNVHRKSTTTDTYQWLKNNNYPEGFQVLCMNCNWGKYSKGICPHEILKGVD